MEKTKTTKTTKKSSTALGKFMPLILPPVLIILFMMFCFYKMKMYPFGTKSVSWCDMTQQVVPLLNMFKDILDGKQSMFLNFENAGGMDFYGVFFFFLSSPFSFLVKFVPKSDVMMFANVLCMLKMATSAFTSALCLRYCHKHLDGASIVLLSVMYPLCGYTMMYYQNNIWLDMMYLFPLLIMSLMKITRHNRPLMYTLVLAASMIVNYYIGYMVVVFILLFTAVYCYGNKGSDNLNHVCRDIFTGSCIAALLSAVVWLPSLIQYFKSGRGETSVYDTIASCDIPTSFTTVLPMLFCTSFLFVPILWDIIKGRQRTERNTRFLILLAFTLIPFIIEPINKMWHTGNYMSFPCRFGYMTVFLAIICVSYVLEQPAPEKVNRYDTAAGLIVAVIIGVCCLKYSTTTIKENTDEISSYAYTLWGDEKSFTLNLGIFFVLIISYSVIFFMYKKKCFPKGLFITLVGIVFAVEAYSNVSIYMDYPATVNKQFNENFGKAYELSNKIDDDEFYRVRSFERFYTENMIGSMGYNSIAHYTSLNNRDYMFTMKRLGYHGVWMKSGSVDGTILTDAFLSCKYSISEARIGSEIVCETGSGTIYKQPYSLPMGLVLEKGSLDGAENIPEDLKRAEVQQYFSEKLFGENLVEIYDNGRDVPTKNGRLLIKNGDEFNYNISVKGRKFIYLDSFGDMTNHLAEPNYNALEVYVNGSRVGISYPDGNHSGFLSLGEFENEDVEITVYVRKTVEDGCSLNVFSVDADRLSEICENAQGANLKTDGSGLKGSCKVEGEKTCVVSVPYNEGFKVKVNGKKVEYRRALSDYIAFDLEDGDNEISISYVSRGFVPGLVISLVGAAVLVLFTKFRRKVEKPMKFDVYAMKIMYAVSVLAMFAIYVLPLLINLLNIKKDK